MAAQQNGYVIVPHNTYDQFRSYALTHGVNVDYRWGNQCWDICALLWYQYGLRLITRPQGNGVAYQCWTISRDLNARGPFKKVYNKTDIKRGDCLVFNQHGSYRTGHIAFADENYNGTNNLHIMGQNQGQGSGWGAASNIWNSPLTYFLGAFRNDNWDNVPPTPPPTPPTPGADTKSNFPWVLYQSKFRRSR